MTELKKEELLEWLAKQSLENGWNIRWDEKDNVDLQAYQQIKQMLQGHPNLEQNMTQGQGKITEEWIEEKAKKLKEGLFGVKMDLDNRIRLGAIRDFIRSLVEEIRGNMSLR